MSELDEVREAAEARHAAEARYRAALVSAVDQLSGAGARDAFAQVAGAAGVSRQAVRQLVQHARENETWMRARLEELDARYEALVDNLACVYRPGDYKRVTAYQNGVNRKLSRRGVGYPTVRVQARDWTESKLLKLVEDRQDVPQVQRLRVELDEAASLRQKLAALDETRAFGSPL